MKFWFYDFEVLKYDWTVTFNDLETNEVVTIVNDVDKLDVFTSEHLGDIFIGFNNLNYDKYIWDGILNGWNPFDMSQRIIADRVAGWKFYKQWKYRTIQYDVYKNLSEGVSLKYAEGNLGIDIIESSIAWDIDRPLTSEELTDTLKYNLHDVLATKELFEKTAATFTSKIMLLQMFKLPISFISKTNAQLTSKILGAVSSDRWKEEIEDGIIDKDYYVAPSTLVLDKYKDVQTDLFGKNIPDDFKSQSLPVAGIKHTFGLGGLHGDTKMKKYSGVLVNIDVVSYYPYIMILYSLLSRNVIDPSVFKQIVEERVKYKKSGTPNDSLLADALKLAINTTYGCLGAQFSDLFDPRMRKSVCITGQLFLLDLIEKLEPLLGITGRDLIEESPFIQSNTDGIMFKLPEGVSIESVKEVVKEWEDRTGFAMEFTYGKNMWQKDVNNYIFETEDGKLKTKGAFTKKATLDFNSAIIVNEALVNYLAYGTMPEEYIKNTNNDLIKYQFIAKGGEMFKKIYHDVDNVKTPLSQKINRCFAVNIESFGSLYKQKEDGETFNKIQNLPPHAIILNEDIRSEKVEVMDKIIDYQFYIDMCWNRISQFTGEELC